MVGSGNFVQQNPFGMVSPAQYGMVSSTPNGMVNPSSYGMVSSTPYGMVSPAQYGMVSSSPYVGLVAQQQRQLTMRPSSGLEMSPFVRSPSSGLLAIQCNDTDDMDTPRMRTPYLEEVRDNMIVGGGNFVQQNPFGMVNPAPFDMISATLYGMVNPSSYGMVILKPCGVVNPTAYGMVNSSPYIRLVAQPQRQVTMCTSFGIEMSPSVRSPSSG
ncbi:unnamed protein product [Mytilus edulis]|uniref:Uncharacterized protein n=1 Tax=Mytilus edulis TaxID=6550 RepID=A0A8S3UJS9_MYTED|nr:unnamed protein product [Mytilus edulis]